MVIVAAEVEELPRTVIEEPVDGLLPLLDIAGDRTVALG